MFVDLTVPLLVYLIVIYCLIISLNNTVCALFVTRIMWNIRSWNRSIYSMYFISLIKLVNRFIYSWRVVL